MLRVLFGFEAFLCTIHTAIRTIGTRQVKEAIDNFLFKELKTEDFYMQATTRIFQREVKLERCSFNVGYTHIIQFLWLCGLFESPLLPIYHAFVTSTHIFAMLRQHFFYILCQFFKTVGGKFQKCKFKEGRAKFRNK